MFSNEKNQLKSNMGPIYHMIRSIEFQFHGGFDWMDDKVYKFEPRSWDKTIETFVPV